MLKTGFRFLLTVGWLEFIVPLQHTYGYIRDEVFTYNTFYVFNAFLIFTAFYGRQVGLPLYSATVVSSFFLFSLHLESALR